MRSLLCSNGRNQAGDEQRQMVLGGYRLSVRFSLYCFAVYLSIRDVVYRSFWVWYGRGVSLDGGISVYAIQESRDWEIICCWIILERFWRLWFYLGLLRRLFLKYAATGEKAAREHAPDVPAVAGGWRNNINKRENLMPDTQAFPWYFLTALHLFIHQLTDAQFVKRNSGIPWKCRILSVTRI